MNDELLKLCQEVYERLPDWKHTDLYHYKRDGDERGWHYIGNDNRDISYGNMQSGFTLDEKDHLIPLYTSDYILEKLMDKEPWVGMTLTDGWIAYTKNWNVRKGGQYVDRCDSALNALLNLVIALHKAGELPS